MERLKNYKWHLNKGGGLTPFHLDFKEMFKQKKCEALPLFLFYDDIQINKT